MLAEPDPGLNGGMRASSTMDGKLRAIHAAWISAIPAEMTFSAILLKHLSNQVHFCPLNVDIYKAKLAVLTL
ncbi:MAG: hypothetical protein KGZ69_07455 [Methylomonas sp.]|nr:hypothetical protein [Methylomonas sp.]